MIGWYKRGDINDRSLIAVQNTKNNITLGGNLNSKTEETLQVEAWNVNYHIVQTIPTNRGFLNPNSAVGRKLIGMKYNVLKIKTFLLIFDMFLMTSFC